MSSRRANAENAGLLLVISCLWGTQFGFNKLALISFTPVMTTFLRTLLGALLLTGMTYILPKRAGSAIPYKLLFVIALFEATLPFLCMAWGQQHIDSAMAAILIGTIPLFVVLIDSFQQKRICKRASCSVLIGFMGVVILLLPAAAVTDLFHHILGILAILAGACCFAVSLFLIKRLPPLSKTVCARTILYWSSLQLLPLLWVLPAAKPTASLTMQAIVAVLILGVFCTGLVYVFYIALVKRAGVVFTSLANYLVPLVGFILGVVLLKEAVHLHIILALILILLALYLGLPKQHTERK